MSIFEYVNENETAIISAFSALLGVLLTLTFNMLQKWLDMRHAVNMKKIDFAIEFQKKHLIEPVILFLDSDLASMREVYSLVFENEPKKSNAKIKIDHLVMLPSIHARVKGIGDENLDKLFSAFTIKRLKIGNAVFNQDKDPYIELQSAIELAGEIIFILLEQSNPKQYETNKKFKSFASLTGTRIKPRAP